MKRLLGNRIWNCANAVVLPSELLLGSGNMLFANNTFFATGQCVQFADMAKNLPGIEFRNNLLLSDGANDITFVGKDRSALDQVRFDHNWRQVRSATPGAADAAGLIGAANDQIRDKIELLSTDPSSPDFLRPAKDSPLARQGAGQTDPRLPMYVGAVPAEGITPWDWDRTWRMPKDAQLLTVSKDEKDGGQYRTINDALKAAKPWATVRVLDEGTYEEPIVLDDMNKQLGIALEGRATLTLTPSFRELIAIKDVGWVQMKGFKLRASGVRDQGAFVSVKGECFGCIIEDLDIRAFEVVTGVRIDGLAIPPDRPPLVIQSCRIAVPHGAIRVFGSEDRPSRSILLAMNRIQDSLLGIQFKGRIEQALIASNIIHNCTFGAVQLEDITKGSSNILVANNTLFDCEQMVLRVWDNPPDDEYEHGQVLVKNNVIFGGTNCDIGFVKPTTSAENPHVPGNRDQLNRLWRFADNWRDLQGSDTRYMFPLAPADKRMDKIDFNTKDSSSPDYLRPAAGSPLATGGAGKDDPSLPLYIGAVPPKGVEPWDWNKTWRWRMARHKQSENSQP